MATASRRAVERPGSPDRRRAPWSEFRAAYPGVVATAGFALLALLLIDVGLVWRRITYEREYRRLRSGLSDVQRQRADAVVANDRDRLQMIMALGRVQAAGDKRLHLSVAVDSGRMTLERDRAALRVIPVQFGPERTVGTAPDTVRMVVPRGQRTVVQVLGPDAPWEVPRWAYADRGLNPPTERTLKGALGPAAIILNGGTVLYSMPTVGPLNDSAYVMPGSVRLAAADLQAILANVEPGMSVYFY